MLKSFSVYPLLINLGNAFSLQSLFFRYLSWLHYSFNWTNSVKRYPDKSTGLHGRRSSTAPGLVICVSEKRIFMRLQKYGRHCSYIFTHLAVFCWNSQVIEHHLICFTLLSCLHLYPTTLIRHPEDNYSN